MAQKILESKTRNRELDILKGISIIVVVAIHARMPVMKWLQLVQMQLFFIVAGFCYSSRITESTMSMKNYVIKRMKSLYVPCLLWSLSVTLLHNVLLKISLISGNIYSAKQMVVQVVKCLFFSGGGQLSGTIWFLRTMFCASILYMLIDWCGRKFKHQGSFRWIICLMLLLIGWLADYYDIPGKQYFNIFSVLFLYEMGRIIREEKISVAYPGHGKKANVAIRCAIMLFLVIALHGLKQIGGIAVNSNIITNPMYFIICSILGWPLFVAASNTIEHMPVIGSGLSYIGKHTLPIMLFHFASFKFVTLIQICIYGYDMNELSSFPCLIIENGWWFVYIVCGMFLPLLAYKLYFAIKPYLVLRLGEK